MATSEAIFQLCYFGKKETTIAVVKLIRTLINMDCQDY
jgi:hypothetical protein